MKMLSLKRGAIVALASLAILPSAALRGQLVWNGSADANWSTAANWTPNQAPADTDALTFTGTLNTATSNDLVDFLAGGLTFDNTSTGGVFTLGGNAITLGGDILTLGSTGGPLAHTISLAMLLNGDRQVHTALDNDLTLTGALTEDATPRTLTKAGAGVLMLDSGAAMFQEHFIFSGLAIQEGAVVLASAAAGNQTLTAALTLDGGTLRTTEITNNWTATGGITVGAGGGTLDLDNGARIILTSNGLSGGGTLVKTGAGGLRLQTANSGFSGVIEVLEGNLEINTGNNALPAGTVTRLNGGNVQAVNADRAVFGALEIQANATFSSTGGDNAWKQTYHGTVSLGDAVRVLTINAVGGVEFAAEVSGAGGGIEKLGGRDLILSAANSYTGDTLLGNGLLLLNHAAALPEAGALAFAGGVLGLGAADFTRATGAGAGLVEWTGNGGFAAYGADRVVNLGGAGAVVTWAADGFVPEGGNLILGRAGSTHKVVFANPLDLGGGSRNVQAVAGEGEVAGELAGPFSNGTLTKVGNGVLQLGSTASTGDLAINAGAVRATQETLPSGNVRFSGGTLQMSGVFTGVFGTGPGQLDQSSNANSFSAAGGDLTLNFGGAQETLVYGSAGFRPEGSTGWTLNGNDATHNITILNPIDFAGGGNKTITVQTGVVTLQGAVTNSANAFFKSGNGALVIVEDNRVSTGATRVNSGMLVLPDLGKNSNFQMQNGGVLGGAGSFTRGLGTNQSTFQFLTGGSGGSGGSGGFAAYGGDFTVNIGGASEPQTWGAAGTIRFLSDGAEFVLGHASATHTVDFQNPLDLNGAQRVLRVDDGAAAVDAILSAALSGDAASGLTKSGAGTLALAAENTYAGATIVADGILSLGLGGTEGGLAGTSGIEMSAATAFFQIRRSDDLIFGKLMTGAGGFRQAGAGTTTLTAANTYTGATILEDGVLVADAAEDAGVSGALGAGGDITFTGGTLRLTAASAGADYSARFRNSSAAIRLDTAGQNMTLSTAIDASNTGGLFKTGEGVLTITVIGAYTGGLILDQGTLALGNNNPVPEGETITLREGVTLMTADSVNRNLGRRVIAEGSFTLGNADFPDGQVTLSGGVDLGDATRTITVVSNLVVINSTPVTATDAAAGIIKEGPGELRFGGANIAEFLGQIVVNAGIVNFNGDHSTAWAAANNPGKVVLNPGGALVFNNNNGAGSREIEVNGGIVRPFNNNARTLTNNLQIKGDFTLGEADPGTGTGTMILNGAVDLNGGARVITVPDNGKANSIGGVISNGGLVKDGAGVLVLSGANTHTGGTSVLAGVLQLDGDQSAATGAVQVAAAGTLAGTGTLGGHATASGEIRPGGSAGADRGLLTFGGDLDIEDGRLVLTAAGSGTRGTDYDALDIGGTLTLGAATTVDFLPDSGFSVAEGDVFHLLDWGALVDNGFVTGTDGRQGGTGGGNLNLPDISGFGGGFLGWDVGGFLTGGTLAVVVVPEPSRALLLFAAGACLLLRRGRGW